jgi:PRTRC genetic system protein E
MFQELQALIQSSESIVLTMAKASEGRITVTVLPKSKQDANEPKLATPLQLTGTPEELDQEFGTLLTSYTEIRATLAEQAEATETILNEAKKASEKKATKAIAKPAANTESKGPEKSGEETPDDENGSNDSKPETPDAEQPAAVDSDNLWG